MQPFVTCLWFDSEAEEAAAFYTQLFPDSKLGAVTPYASESPGGKKPGDVMTVEFEINGQKFLGLNGGPLFRFDEAISIQVVCADQAEIDRYWDAIVGNGGEEGPCGWCKDRWGLSWQITPEQLPKLLAPDNPARAKAVTDAFMQMKKLDIAAIEAAARRAA
ncbi:VOC family protein [Phenylobacterium sp.]|uniref:VOC family protein n=1 Tax=Phenylobacterium sp. TaxID=1871053 RepID=UPI0025CE1745|nr:VOC family protein [Phenylobacterium sp.]MBX3482954.1 VOC family protein [Phenylobacterium sp.]MCW5759497.1 VOC family protein [Phenylobacterium sp.]